MWRWFWKFADATMPQTKNGRILFATIVFLCGLAFTAGRMWEKFITIDSKQLSVTVAANASTSGLKTCEVLYEVSRVQSTYGTQIEPVRTRWLDLTAKLARDDMLNSERENVAETEKLVQRELQRLQTNHQEIVTGITQACIPK